MIRLLDKVSISEQKNAERKREIDEGIKIARKVDALREASATEEAKLYRIREATTAQVRAEIAELVDQKERVAQQVESLTVERTKLEEPLTKEWALLDAKKLELEMIKAKLAIREKEVGDIESNQQEREKELKVEEERIADIKSVAMNVAKEVENTKQQADILLVSAQERAENILESATLREREVIGRELVLAGSERDILNHKELLDRRERKLDIRERAINDKYETLQRTIKRLKNNG